jgi:hypothetical protein
MSSQSFSALARKCRDMFSEGNAAHSVGYDSLLQSAAEPDMDPDPESGIRCLFDPWIGDQGSGMGKISGSGSWISNPDHISES